MAGIDAPEKWQPFGHRSQQSLLRLVSGKQMHWHQHDRYRWIVGKVMAAEPECTTVPCPKTHDAGLDQVSAGLAWWYRKYGKEQLPQDANAYENAQDQAHARRAGLWVDPQPTAPWDWRKRH